MLIDDGARDELVEKVLAREQTRGLRARLRRLPEPQRVVILLAYYGELTHKEIAHVLDVPLGTVEERMQLAFEALRIDWARSAKSP